MAFVDSDCVPPEGWLDPLLGHFDDPLVGAVSPRIVAAAPEPGRVVARYEQVRSSLDRGPGPAPVRPGSPVPFVPSAALVVRAEVVRGGGLFDPSLRGGEDVDLVWRLVESGWDVRYVPESVVAHDGATSVGAFLTRRAFYGTTAGPLARRHGDALAPVQASAWSAAVWLLALGRRPVLAATTQAVSVAVLAARLRGLVGEPVPVAWRIAGGGTARSAAPALGGLARAWSPLLVLGLAFGRTRRVCAAALLVPAVHDRAQAPGDLDPVRYAVLHMADDLAYGVGVWMGCVRARTLAPARPAPRVAGARVVIGRAAAQSGHRPPTRVGSKVPTRIHLGPKALEPEVPVCRHWSCARSHSPLWHRSPVGGQVAAQPRRTRGRR